MTRIRKQLTIVIIVFFIKMYNITYTKERDKFREYA